MTLEPLDCLCGADILIGYVGSAESQQTIGGCGAVAREMTIGFADLLSAVVRGHRGDDALPAGASRLDDRSYCQSYGVVWIVGNRWVHQAKRPISSRILLDKFECTVDCRRSGRRCRFRHGQQ